MDELERLRRENIALVKLSSESNVNAGKYEAELNRATKKIKELERSVTRLEAELWNVVRAHAHHLVTVPNYEVPHVGEIVTSFSGSSTVFMAMTPEEHDAYIAHLEDME